MRRTVIAMLLAVLSWVEPAQAQDKPLYLPVRDVAVTYRLSGTPGGGDVAPGPGREAHLYFSAALNKLRLEQSAQKDYVLIDRGAQKMAAVMTKQHSVMEMPFQPELAQGLILNDQMQFSRDGADTIAGLACTKWHVVSARATGTVCVTADGVMLRGEGRAKDGSVQTIEATSVAYGAQPASLFDVPPDFTPMRLPTVRIAP